MLDTQELQARALRVVLQHLNLLLGREPATNVQSTRIPMRRARLTVFAVHGPSNKMVNVKVATPGGICIRMLRIVHKHGKIVTGRQTTTDCDIFVDIATPIKSLLQTVCPRPVARAISGMATLVGRVLYVKKGRTMMPRSCFARNVLSVRPQRGWKE